MRNEPQIVSTLGAEFWNKKLGLIDLVKHYEASVTNIAVRQMNYTSYVRKRGIKPRKVKVINLNKVFNSVAEIAKLFDCSTALINRLAWNNEESKTMFIKHGDLRKITGNATASSNVVKANEWLNDGYKPLKVEYVE